jgi:hypothetical protein
MSRARLILSKLEENREKELTFTHPRTGKKMKTSTREWSPQERADADRSRFTEKEWKTIKHRYNLPRK